MLINKVLFPESLINQSSILHKSFKVLENVKSEISRVTATFLPKMNRLTTETQAPNPKQMANSCQIVSSLGIPTQISRCHTEETCDVLHLVSTTFYLLYKFPLEWEINKSLPLTIVSILGIMGNTVLFCGSYWEETSCRTLYSIYWTPLANVFQVPEIP